MNRIIVTESYIKCIDTDSSGKKTFKFISYDEFAKLLSSNLTISTGLIKQNCKYKILKYDYYKSFHVYTYLFEETKRDIKWGTEHFKNFPIPERIWVGIWKNDMTLYNSFLYAYNAGIQQLYHFPLPNVYNENRICWGEEKMSAYKPEHIDAIDGTFFSAPFNSDIMPFGITQFNEWTKRQNKLRSFSWALLQKYTAPVQSFNNFLKNKYV